MEKEILIHINSMSDFIETLFKTEPYPPLSFDIQFSSKTVDDLFQQIIQIFIKGCSILYGNGYSFSAFDLSENRIKTMQKYMRSIGIECSFYSYSIKEGDEIYKDFIHEFKMLIEESTFSQNDYYHILFRDKNGFIVNTKWFFKEPMVRDLFRLAIKTQTHYNNMFSVVSEKKTKLEDYAYRVRLPHQFCILRFKII